MSSGINLLGRKKQAPITPAARRLRMLRFIAVGVLFFISALSVIFFILIALSPLPSLQEQERGALATFSPHHPDVAKLALVTDRLNASARILAARPRFDEMLAKVREKMPSGIAVTDLSIEENTLSITVSSSSLGLLDTFLTNLLTATEAKKDFSKVVLTSLFMNQQSNSFIMTVDLVTL